MTATHCTWQLFPLDLIMVNKSYAIKEELAASWLFEFGLSLCLDTYGVLTETSHCSKSLNKAGAFFMANLSLYTNKWVREIRSLADKDIESDPKARRALLGAAQKLTATLETPPEAFWRFTMQSAANASLRAAVEMGLIDAVVNSSDGQMSARELSALNGHSRLLIVRPLRLLASVGVVDEVGPETYQATEFCRHLVIPNVKDGVKHLSVLPALNSRSFFLFVPLTPVQLPDGAFQFAFETKLNLFAWYKAHPERLKVFGSFMSAHRSGRPLWFTFYPVEEKLCQGLQPGDDAALIVDVGGGMGHDLAAFKAAYPSVRGRLILQDLPETIDAIDDKLDASVESMSHDFFTPQPVTGARTYYFSTVLHDWPDSSCRTILHHIAAATKKGYSRLLINDFALRDMNCPPIAAAFDLDMMAMLGGMERTRTQWQDLLAEAGLEVVKYWTYEGGESDGLIEARLKES